jgi:1-acyl-sn-glycerol-3-phosphate acyltransferase
MKASMQSIASLPPEQLRTLLPPFLAAAIQGNPAVADLAQQSVTDLLAESDDGAIQRTLKTWSTLGEQGYKSYSAIPLMRELSRAWMHHVLTPGAVEGAEHLSSVRGRNQLWICNHRSYIDTQATDALLNQAGLDILADDMLVVAGPKVYSAPFRRLAAAGLNTLLVAQSTQIGHNQAELTPRQVAEIAINTLKLSQAWRSERGPVLLYPEGTRTRTGRLGPFLRASARYARHAQVIVPMAITGTDRLFGLDEKMRPCSVTLRIGQPFAPPKGKTAWLEQAHAAVAGLLPEENQPNGDVLI